MVSIYIQQRAYSLRAKMFTSGLLLWQLSRQLDRLQLKTDSRPVSIGMLFELIVTGPFVQSTLAILNTPYLELFSRSVGGP